MNAQVMVGEGGGWAAPPTLSSTPVDGPGDGFRRELLHTPSATTVGEPISHKTSLIIILAKKAHTPCKKPP